MSDAPTGTDRVELPPHEKELRKLWREVAEKGIEGGVDYPRIVTTLFGDIDALTAERDEQRAIITQLRGNLHACPKQQKAEAERDAARVELAALVTALGFDTRDPMIGRTHAERATEMVKRYDDLAAELAAANARCAELTTALREANDARDRHLTENDSLQKRIADSEYHLEARVQQGLTDLERNASLRAENGALQATLDRVTALADEVEHMSLDEWDTRSPEGIAEELRAALTPKGKHVNCNCDDCDEERSLDPTPKGRP